MLKGEFFRVFFHSAFVKCNLSYKFILPILRFTIDVMFKYIKRY